MGKRTEWAVRTDKRIEMAGNSLKFVSTSRKSKLFVRLNFLKADSPRAVSTVGDDAHIVPHFLYEFITDIRINTGACPIMNYE